MSDRKPFVVKSHDIHLDSDYVQWLAEVKNRYRRARIKASIRVNSEQLLFNWQLGRDLVLKKAEEKWGGGVVEQVSLDLQAEFPGVKGFSVRNLWNMKKWYLFYSSADSFPEKVFSLEKMMNSYSRKLQQVVAELPSEKLQQAQH